MSQKKKRSFGSMLFGARESNAPVAANNDPKPRGAVAVAPVAVVPAPVADARPAAAPPDGVDAGPADAVAADPASSAATSSDDLLSAITAAMQDREADRVSAEAEAELIRLVMPALERQGRGGLVQAVEDALKGRGPALRSDETAPGTIALRKPSAPARGADLMMPHALPEVDRAPPSHPANAAEVMRDPRLLDPGGPAVIAAPLARPRELPPVRGFALDDQPFQDPRSALAYDHTPFTVPVAPLSELPPPVEAAGDAGFATAAPIVPDAAPAEASPDAAATDEPETMEVPVGEPPAEDAPEASSDLVQAATADDVAASSPADIDVADATVADQPQPAQADPDRVSVDAQLEEPTPTVAPQLVAPTASPVEDPAIPAPPFENQPQYVAADLAQVEDRPREPVDIDAARLEPSHDAGAADIVAPEMPAAAGIEAPVATQHFVSDQSIQPEPSAFAAESAPTFQPEVPSTMSALQVVASAPPPMRRASPSGDAALDSALETAIGIDGGLCAAVTVIATGDNLGSAGTGADAAVAGHSLAAVLRSKLKIIGMLRLNDDLEDMIVTTGTQFHLIRMIDGQRFLFVVLDRRIANLALARYRASEAVDQLRGAAS